MTKIDQIEAAAKADLNDEGQCDAFMELYGLKTVLKMCAVIKAASGFHSSNQRRQLRAALQELNND